jgi:hypothetical protein
MENNKNIAKKDLINEGSFEKLSQIYRELNGREYEPDEFFKKASESKTTKTKESDIDEGKLFTKFLKSKIR